MTASADDDAKVADNLALKPTVLTLYGKMLTFSRMRIETDDLTQIEAVLAKLLTNKTSQIPIIIESDINQNLCALIDIFWSWGLQPIGVVDGILNPQAIKMRLAIFPGDGKRIGSITPSPKTASKSKNMTTQTNADPSIATKSQATDPDIPLSNMVYDQILRSGQSINHVGGDLILTNSINNGAEVITDNSLHIYGRASGRLVAGATGDKNARIFCQSFNPSLVSVAGTYCLKDNIPADMIDKPVQVSFVEGEGLKFEIMNSN